MSIGVIGGADGPTAIFVAGGPGPLLLVGVVVIGVAAVCAAVVFVRRKRKK
ncbi:hypothetical protein [Anoxybacterium hadale]|uniref:hypothetical protein n=1 Tax=Anoxybacterium hadale TaxID=3408580 RepID=UPI003B00C79F